MWDSRVLKYWSKIKRDSTPERNDGMGLNSNGIIDSDHIGSKVTKWGKLRLGDVNGSKLFGDRIRDKIKDHIKDKITDNISEFISETKIHDHLKRKTQVVSTELYARSFNRNEDTECVCRNKSAKIISAKRQKRNRLRWRRRNLSVSH